MQLKPINDYICVKPEPVVNRTASGIVFVDKQESRPAKGTAVRVSDKIQDIKEGSTILYVMGAGEKIKLDGEEFLILAKEKIVGVVK